MTLTLSTSAASPAAVKEESWEEGKAPRFNANDRCDKCGAQAYVKATFNSGGFLLLCAHDAKAQRPSMESKGILTGWYSETDRLKENRKQGSEN